MDESLRHTLASAFVATGCLLSSAAHAYSAAEDADAQDREVKAAYDRGYKAAKEELAREAATKSVAATSSPDTAVPGAKAVSNAPRKPILDIKHVYSETSDIETVQEVPVTSTPLPENKGTQSAAPHAARFRQPQSVARRASPASSDDWIESGTPQARQPVQRPSAQARSAAVVRPTGRVQQEDTASREELAEDDGYDPEMPREARVYSTQPQYARPRAQYAPPPVVIRSTPQAYGYGQPPTYSTARPYAYYAPGNASYDGYRPSPYAGRWYWSPEYGRWLYY